MATPRKPKGKAGKNARSGSALDSEQRLLQEQQRMLQAQIDALQRTIAEAPQRSVEEKRRNRETLIQQQQRAQYRLNATPAEAVPAVRRPGGKRPRPVVLRAEKEAGRLQTFALLVVVIAAAIWALSRYL